MLKQLVKEWISIYGEVFKLIIQIIVGCISLVTTIIALPFILLMYHFNKNYRIRMNKKYCSEVSS